jgi:signal transduction histidine kinase/DNA-binding response OmpR family regulator/methyl-accepting chemotaxis protein
LAGYIALKVVQRQTETAILTSIGIQRLVLQMDAGLQHARRLERDFFLRWPTIGFAEARQTYAQGNNEQIAEVVKLSAQLQQLIAQSDVSEALRQSNVNLNLYLSAADRYAAAFNEAVELVAKLATADTGAQARLAQNSASLRDTLQLANDPALMNLYREMQSYEKDYLLTRQRPFMQSAFNVVSALREAIHNSAGLDASQREQALASLDAYLAVADEVLQLDVDIRSKFNEFDLQAEAVDPISVQLTTLASDEVQRASAQIASTGQLATTLLVGAVVAAVALASIIAWVLNKSITHNVLRLTEAAIELQGGNLAVQAQVDSADELGQLADSFNSMAARIKTLVGNLEGQVAAAQARLFQAIESISEGFALYDANDQFVLANRKYRELHGEIAHLVVPPIHFKQLIQIGAERGLYPDAVGRIEAWVNERLERHNQPHGPFEQPLGEGHWLQVSEYQTQEGEIVGIYTDITARKQAEEELRQQNEYLAALHDTALGLISRLDLNELLQTLVTRAGQLLGAPYGFVYLVEPGSTELELKIAVGLTGHQIGEGHKFGEGFVGRIWQTAQPLVVDDYDAWPGRSKNVAYGVIRATVGVPLTHQTGEGHAKPEVVGVIELAFGRESEQTFGQREIEVLTRFSQLASIAIDNARLYTETQQAREAAEAANQAKSAFLSTVSHELRTPLTSVLGFAKISQQSLENRLFPAIQTDDRKIQREIRHVRENLEIIVNEGERLTTLINNVLDLAKIEAGKVEWMMQPLAISSVIERATATTAALFEKKGLVLVKEVADRLPEVIGDQDKLIQVVINLISNAVKFTQQGTVTCRVQPSNGEIVVSIIDTGMGIAPEDQPKVFEKFKQVGDTLTDKPQGTGLGLSICKEIVEYHGGRIWVESELGQGSTFFFSLPAQAEIEAERVTWPLDLAALIKQLKAHVVAITPNSAATPKNILVVDDEAPIRKLLSQELGEAGYRVSEASNGQEALRQIRREKPDLVLLDVLMPKMNGFHVAAVLKNDPQTMDVPIIILTIVEDKERGYRLGVDRYLTKPINTKALLDEIEVLLARNATPKNVLIVDKDTATVQTLAEVLQEKGYDVREVHDAPAFVEQAVSAKSDVILAHAGFLEQGHLVRTLRFEQGLENVVMLFYQ